MVCAAVMIVPPAIVVDQAWKLSPTPQAWIALFTLATVSTTFATVLYFRLVKTLGPFGTDVAPRA